ncbi:SctK family type III secretion system sorting platform protein [Pseudomonas entomophila]|uniref:SctK family type III secretion system sorting platform protein n=1 Tax=Pseudomonas entomophila TaxID=312306 RepID=UPI0024051765|nr:SctK family type III secretion system sorting platform protein [Pseudomonas entomophila]MDF9618770.1 SctK family type III secretion system sorting platform protein [Pseudomonas entomophila]
MTAYQLRYCPARYIYPGWMPSPLQVLAHALPDWRCEGRVNAWLLSEMGLPLDYTMPQRLGGVALFPAQQLRSTLGMLGAMLHARAIRQLVDVGSLRRVHAAIGAQGHRYCLEHHALLIGTWPEDWQCALPAGDLDEYLPACGLDFWLQAIGEVDQGFARRLQLRHAQVPVAAPFEVAAEQRPLAQILCLKIARHTSPTCLHLLD